MRVGLIVIATGKYDRFVPDLWTSARQHFLVGHDRQLLLLAERPLDLPDCVFLPTGHEPWPGPTLHRYRSMLRHTVKLRRMDYLFYTDADMRFVAPVSDEILGDLVATIHPGYYNQPKEAWTYERRPESRAHVPPGAGHRYFCGGFQGGQADRYLSAATALDEAVTADEHNGVIAVWHDESHWNRYLIDYPPAVELSPSYCFPEGWPLPFQPRLLALNKDHGDLRT